MTFPFQGHDEKVPDVKCWYPHAVVYDPIKVGSIDGTDIRPHDNGVVRAVRSQYKPSYKALGNPLNTIFIGRLSMDTKEKDLEKVFHHYGKMVALRIVKDLVTGLSKRYAFIEYETFKMALNAYVCAKSLVINNSEVFVDFECGRLLPGWKPRRLGGGFGGEKQSGQLRFGGRMRNFRQPLNLVESKRNKNCKEDNTEVMSSTSCSSTKKPHPSSNDISASRSLSSRRPYSSSNDFSTKHPSTTRRPHSRSKNISSRRSPSTKRPYSSSNHYSTAYSSSLSRSYSSTLNIPTSRSPSAKRAYLSSNNFSTLYSSSSSRPHSNSKNGSTVHSSSSSKPCSSSKNASTSHSSSISRPHSNSNYISCTPAPSTISLPLTPPSNPTIVLPLTPPSHSNVVLPLTPPTQAIIVLPLTPPSNPIVNLPLTPPSQSQSVPLPLTPPHNFM